MIALSLASAAFMAVMAISAAMLRAQLRLAREQRAQAEALLALKALGQAISQASAVIEPAPGAQGDVLSVCSNYSPLIAAPLDGGQPVRGVHCCARSGSLYAHSALACPVAVAACGEGGAAAAIGFGRAEGNLSFFKRPAGQNLVETRFQASFADSTQRVEAVFATLSAGGSNQ
jgi:hypothetical protein